MPLPPDTERFSHDEEAALESELSKESERRCTEKESPLDRKPSSNLQSGNNIQCKTRWFENITITRSKETTNDITVPATATFTYVIFQP